MKFNLIFIVTIFLGVFTEVLPLFAQDDYPVTQIPNVTNRLNDIAFLPNTNEVIIVGNNIILKSEYDGHSWRKVFGGEDSIFYDGIWMAISDSNPQIPILTSIHAFNSKKVIVAGGIYQNDKSYHHLLLLSNDGGNSWDQILNEPSPDTISRFPFPPNYVKGVLNDIYFIDEETGWAVDNGLVMKTIDGGNNWNYFPLNNLETNRFHIEVFTSISFIDKNVGWISSAVSNFSDEYGGIGGTILKSEDGGENWKDDGNIGGRILENIYLNKNSKSYKGWAAGGRSAGDIITGDYVIAQLDSNLKWDFYPIDNSYTEYPFTRIDVNINGVGCCIGQNGQYRTTNNWGEDWYYDYKHYDFKRININSVAVSDNNRIIGVGNEGVIIYIDDFLSIKPNVEYKPIKTKTIESSIPFDLGGRKLKSLTNISKGIVLYKTPHGIIKRYKYY